jgi:tetratricopeptide (TPR) repeat protein
MEITTYITIGFIIFVIIIGIISLYQYVTSPGNEEEAEVLINKGQFKDAILLLEKLLEKDERNPTANFLSGLAYEKIGDYQNAIMYYKRILKFGRYNQRINEILARKHLAYALESSGNYTDAKNEYLILTKIEPTNADNFYHAGKLLYMGKAYQNAINLLKQAVQINSRHFAALSTLGKALFHIKIYSEAKIYLEKAKDIDPKEPENLYYLAQTYRYLGEFNKALQLLDIVEKDPKIKPKALLLKGLILIDTESYSQAINELDKAIVHLNKGSNDDLFAHYLMSIAYEKLKNITKAIEHWEYIEGIQPNYKDVKEKLKQYAEFKTSDAIKDLLISNRIQFETFFRKLLDKLKLKPLLINVDSDSVITGVCTDYGQNSPYKVNNILVRLYREVHPISEMQVREFHDKMKSENATRGIYLTVSEFSSSAIDYCNNRPIELYDGKALTKLLES